MIKSRYHQKQFNGINWRTHACQSMRVCLFRILSYRVRCVCMKHLLELNIEMFLKLLLFPCYSWILTIVVWIHTHTYLSWEIRHQRDFSNDHYYCERHQKYFLSVLWSDYCVRVCVCVQLHWKYKEFKINCTQTETHSIFNRLLPHRNKVIIFLFLLWFAFIWFT